MNVFAQQCISLRKKDYSLPEISKITGRAKTSIYYYIRNLPLSAERVLQTRKKNAAHMRSLALGRKGLSAKAFVFDIERFLKLGVDRCLSKPVELRELALTARRLIDDTRPESKASHH